MARTAFSTKPSKAGGSGIKRVILQLYRYATTSYAAGFWDWSLGTWNTNSASWQQATTGDNWANWSVALPPLAVGGEYKITARAFDVANNFESATALFRMVAAASTAPSAALSGAVQLSSATIRLAPCRVALKFSGPL